MSESTFSRQIADLEQRMCKLEREIRKMNPLQKAIDDLASGFVIFKTTVTTALADFAAQLAAQASSTTDAEAATNIEAIVSQMQAFQATVAGEDPGPVATPAA